MTESKKKRFARLRLFRQFYDMQARAESAESECSELTARLFFAEGEVQRLHATHNEFVNEVSGDVAALPFALRKVEELEAENEQLRMEIDRLKELSSTKDLTAIQKVLGNGCDEVAWPPGTHYADALGPYVDRLHAEIERLRKLGIEQCENTPVHSVNVDGGACEVVTTPPHWAIKVMAGSFAETLADAPNWMSYEVGPIPSNQGNLIVTVCRASGDSPVETCTKLKNIVEELIGNAGSSAFNQAVLDRAHHLINPEKKDS